MSSSAAPASPFHPPTAVASAKNDVAVGIALTAYERSLFFADSSAAPLPAGMQWFAESELEPAAWERALRRMNPTVLVTAWRTPPIPSSWLDEPGCALRYVCHVTGSVRGCVPRSFIERGGLVTNWGAVASPQVAEHALLLALAALRNAGAWRSYIARAPAARQLADLDTRTLFGRRIGIHGFGGVAHALLPLLRPFGVEVAVSASVPAAIIAAAGAKPYNSLPELCARSDVFFECEALTPATVGMLSAAHVAALPAGAVFVNVGRGGVVDEPALIAAARAGRIRLAVDVSWDEPLTSSSPLLDIPGVIVSPHIGGPTLDRYADCGARARMNVARFLAGEVPDAVITAEIFDRST